MHEILSNLPIDRKFYIVLNTSFSKVQYAVQTILKIACENTNQTKGFTCQTFLKCFTSLTHPTSYCWGWDIFQFRSKYVIYIQWQNTFHFLIINLINALSLNDAHVCCFVSFNANILNNLLGNSVLT